MSELVTVYPSKPPVAGGYSNPGAILYRGVYFSVTLRAAIYGDGKDGGIEHGSMIGAMKLMNDIVDAHESGAIVLSGEVLYRDPEDQRPASEVAPRQSNSQNDEFLFRDTKPAQVPIEGNTPVKTAHGIEIQRNSKNNKVDYEITTEFNGQVDENKRRIWGTENVPILETAMRAAGVDPEKLTFGKSFKLDIECRWTNTQGKDGKNYSHYQFTVQRPNS